MRWLTLLLCLATGLAFAVVTYAPTDTQRMHKRGDRLSAKLPINTVELTRDTPTLREDNSALLPSEIKGYVTQDWTNPDAISTVKVPATNKYYLFDLPAGTYTMQIATEDTDNQVSNFSSTITVEVL